MGGNLLNHSNVSTLSHETIPKVFADSGPENSLPSHSVAPSSRGQGEELKTCAVYADAKRISPGILEFLARISKNLTMFSF